MKFIADAMLGSLAKRLRLLGIDVLYDPAWQDNDILRIALQQGRVILTRDSGIAARPLAQDHIFVGSDHIDEQLQQVLAIFPVQDTSALTRCSVCNGVLSPLDRAAARDSVPEHVYATIKAFFHCDQCGRIYWEGSHLRNLRKRTRRS